jgi:hypothetical protein
LSRNPEPGRVKRAAFSVAVAGPRPQRARHSKVCQLTLSSLPHHFPSP